MGVRRVISGGQVGADVAGLRAAKRLGLETGGWMPRGWRTIAGPRPDRGDEYGMKECRTGGYPTRTRRNVEAADATVRFASDFGTAGERLTLRYCRELGRPCFDVRLDLRGRPFYEPYPDHLRRWLAYHGVVSLNVAGNADPAIEQLVEDYLAWALCDVDNLPFEEEQRASLLYNDLQGNIT